MMPRPRASFAESAWRAALQLLSASACCHTPGHRLAAMIRGSCSHTQGEQQAAIHFAQLVCLLSHKGRAAARGRGPPQSIPSRCSGHQAAMRAAACAWPGKRRELWELGARVQNSGPHSPWLRRRPRPGLSRAAPRQPARPCPAQGCADLLHPQQRAICGRAERSGVCD